jgi:hypothetical protein
VKDPVFHRLIPPLSTPSELILHHALLNNADILFLLQFFMSYHTHIIHTRSHSSLFFFPFPMNDFKKRNDLEDESFGLQTIAPR